MVRLSNLALLAWACDATPTFTTPIKHFVVTMMENRPPDHMLGCAARAGLLPGFDGPPASIVKDPNNLSAGVLNLTCGSADLVCECCPEYDLFAPKFEPGIDAGSYPYPPQSDDWSYLRGATEASTTTRLFAPEQMPVLTALATNFTVFNKFFSSVPAPSIPHHMFSQSGTSCGANDNVAYSQCNGVTPEVDDPEGPWGVKWPFVANRTFNLYPQRVIYDALKEAGVDYKIYANSTVLQHGRTAIGHYADFEMGRMFYHRRNIVGMAEFWEAAREGALPNFAWLPPSNFDNNVFDAPMDDHPCHDVAKGERFLKDVYEALRASPAWNETLWLIFFDDAGSVYDHVVPPSEGVPAPEAPCDLVAGNRGCPNAFDFRRLGLRVTTLAVSPWLARGVVQEPAGPTSTSQWEHSSIPATAKNLFNLSAFLTKRDAWAGSLTELLTPESEGPRNQGPAHLPEAPPPAAEAEDDACADPDDALDRRRCKPPTRRQARALQLVGKVRNMPVPSLATHTFASAQKLLTEHWTEMMSMDFDALLSGDGAVLDA